MSARSPVHENRVALLDACAVLSGHLSPARLALGQYPDVVRLDTLRRRLFIGDAKATETPGCAATTARVHAYARSIRSWTNRGFTVRLALCHGRQDQAGAWTALLEHAARCAHIRVSPAGCDDLGPGTILTWIDAEPSPPHVRAKILDDAGASQ